MASTVPSAALPGNAAKMQVKLEDRLSKAEARIHDLQREKATAQNELGDLQTELRLAAQREAKLKHSLEKWEKSHAMLKEKNTKLADLQLRLGELHKVHEESKARRQKEIDDLGEKLKREEERRRHELAEARHALAEEKARAQDNQTKCDAVQAELEHLRRQGMISHDLLKEKQSLIDELQSQRQSDKVIAIDAQKYARKLEVELNQQIKLLTSQMESKTEQAARTTLEQQAAAAAARSELQREIDDLLEELDHVEQQHAHNLAMVAKAVSEQIGALQQQRRSEKDVLCAKWHQNASERIRLEALTDERSAQIHELVGLVKQVQEDRDAAKQHVATLQADLISIMAELAAERQLASTLLEQQEELQQRVSASKSFGDLSGLITVLGDDNAAPSLLRAQLEDALARNALLQDEASELQARLISRSTEAKAAEEALSSARSHVATLETSVAAKARELDSLVSQLSELEPLRRRLATALEEAAAAKQQAKTQAEASSALTASLQNARVAEKAWRDERDRMASLLDQAEHFESLYHELAEQTKHLVERYALAEEQKATLAALNSELLSHNNPNQKIMYMDRIRHELDTTKHENLSLRLQLVRLEEQNTLMQRELSSFKAVDLPLSQRPRAEVTRVVRAADHEGLLRQVSGGIVEHEHTKAKPARTPASAAQGGESLSTPVKTALAIGAKTPFSTHGPRFTAVPLQPELQKRLQTEERAQRKQEEEVEAYTAGAVEGLAHPPLPMDTGLSPKKRRSYGNLSVHAAENQEAAEAEEQHEVHDDTLLPLPTAAETHDADVLAYPAEVAIRRNRPRPTLVNSGALRVAQHPSALPRPSSTSALEAESGPAALPDAATGEGNGTRRPSLATSSLGIKARRVSELVRASTPPLPSIADFSNLETPNTHLLLDAALPSASPYGLPDWTATDETSHVPALNAHHHTFSAITHSTPLPAQPMATDRFRKSRYSGAQRVAHPPSLQDTSSTPKARPKGLLPAARKNGALVAVAEGSTTVYEDEHDSFRNGWIYDDHNRDPVALPDFSIEHNNAHAVQKAKKPKAAKAKARNSMKVVKPGPMARTFFR